MPTPITRSDAALGAILGACVGDAAGAVLEFLGRTPTDADVDRAMTLPGGGCWGVAPGQITDDGELTIALARALAGGGFDLERIARSYAKWIDSPPFDIGTTTTNGLGCIREAKWAEVADAQGYAVAMTRAAAERNHFSKANGSLMRAAPLGMWGATVDGRGGSSPDVHGSPSPGDPGATVHGRGVGTLDVGHLADCARADSRLSHPNPSCADAVACYAIAIATLVRTGGDRAAAVKAAEAWAAMDAEPEVRWWLSDARQLATGDAAAAAEAVPYDRQIGFVRIGFTHAFRHLAAGSDYVTAIRETLAGGGDTDTNACIVGGLVGAACGAPAIPPAMCAKVLACTTESGRHPRPDWLRARQITELVPRILTG